LKNTGFISLNLSKLALKKAVDLFLENLSSFTSNPSDQLDVFWHDGDSLGVNSAHIGVFEDAYQVRFTSHSFERTGRS